LSAGGDEVDAAPVERIEGERRLEVPHALEFPGVRRPVRRNTISTFLEEYREFLRKHGVEYDERYVWD